MTSFDELTTPEPIEGARFRWQIPEGWYQGRTTFGGMVMAAVIRAIEDSGVGGDRPLRSVSAALCGPTVPGPADIAIDLLREGNKVVGITAALSQNGVTATHVTALLGSRRPMDDGTWQILEPPTARHWREMEPLQVGPPMAPMFTQHLAFRSDGPFPFSGNDEPAGLGWVSLLAPGSDRGPAYLAALMDAWWPGVVATFVAPRPVATIAYTIEFLGDFDGLDPDAPLLYRSRMPAARDGYGVEFRELWGEDGRLLALNQQTIAIIK